MCSLGCHGNSVLFRDGSMQAGLGVSVCSAVFRLDCSLGQPYDPMCTHSFKASELCYC
jgi:hypothetical protein